MTMNASLAEPTVSSCAPTRLEAMNAVVTVVTREVQPMEVLAKVLHHYLQKLWYTSAPIIIQDITCIVCIPY